MPSERVQRQTDRLVDEAEVAEVARDWAKVRGVIEHLDFAFRELREMKPVLSLPKGCSRRRSGRRATGGC